MKRSLWVLNVLLSAGTLLAPGIASIAKAQSTAAAPRIVAQATASGVTSSTLNPLQIALKHWYSANLTTSFGVGNDPNGVGFDGANIWVTNFVDATVTKLHANDGQILGT